MASRVCPLTLDCELLFVEILESSPIARPHRAQGPSSKTVHCPIRFQILTEHSLALLVQRDHVVIAAREGPVHAARGQRAPDFKHLPRKRQEGFQRFLSLHSKRAKKSELLFLKARTGGRHDRCRMIKRFTRG